MDIDTIKKESHALGLTAAFILLGIALASIPGDEFSRLTGHATSTKLLVVNIINGTCTADLREGWNLASFFCSALESSVEGYLAELNGTIESIHTYDAFAELDKWRAYNPNLPSWVIDDLTEIKREEGYWINMKSSEILIVNGSMTKPTIIPIKKGWNLVGYPTNYPKNVSQSLQINLGSDWSVVYMYNSSDVSDPWKMNMRNPPPMAIMDLDNFSQEYGYWINSSKTGEWYVNY